MILLILAGASYMGTSMAYTGIPLALASWVNSLQLSPYALIAALTVMYIVLGTALDGISMIVLTTAIVIPMVKQAGFDLVWFGIFVVLVVEMAEVSPPVGFNLFVLQTMSGKDFNTVARASLPFFFLLVLAVAIITVFPDIVMVLPRMAFPARERCFHVQGCKDVRYRRLRRGAALPRSWRRPNGIFRRPIRRTIRIR